MCYHPPTNMSNVEYLKSLHICLLETADVDGLISLNCMKHLRTMHICLLEAADVERFNS